MTEIPKVSDWVTRGQKWRTHLTGNEAMLAPVDEPLISALHLDAPYRIADMGCGGGGTSLEIARRAPQGSVVHGFDISPALIEFARERPGSDEHAIVFEIADMATASPEKPYDRLNARFSLMFFEDPPAAFTNLVRWLAPGGRFAFAVWGRPSENPWMTTVSEVVADVIEMPVADPAGPGLFRYAEPDNFLALLEQAGFGEFDVTDWRGTLPVGGELSAMEAAHFALASFSSFAQLLAEAGDEALNEARQSLTLRFSRHEENNAVRMDASVHIVTGTRR
jgi:trans-aconitate methyltransferase